MIAEALARSAATAAVATGALAVVGLCEKGGGVEMATRERLRVTLAGPITSTRTTTAPSSSTARPSSTASTPAESTTPAERRPSSATVPSSASPASRTRAHTVVRKKALPHTPLHAAESPSPCSFLPRPPPPSPLSLPAHCGSSPRARQRRLRLGSCRRRRGAHSHPRPPQPPPAPLLAPHQLARPRPTAGPAAALPPGRRLGYRAGRSRRGPMGASR